ncbi:MAG: ankyrin repeat domain-containing protein [Saccharospirillaceae bacterium]|nr:ankyrin repeat domain-containing protein [Pseudomonadales bacterium]NRB77978.1 ankyrin repeat domain-containing protein [Saccharospirillaceae bacterium]
MNNDIYSTIVRSDYQGYVKCVDSDYKLSRFNKGQLNVLHASVALRAEKFKSDILLDIINNGDLDIDSKTGADTTALFIAAEKKIPKAVKILCEAGAETSIICRNESTALGVSLSDGWANYDCIKYLLASGADPDAKCAYNNDDEQKTFRELMQTSYDFYSSYLCEEPDEKPKIQVYFDIQELLNQIPVGSRTSTKIVEKEVPKIVKPENWTYKDIVELFVPRSGLADSKQGELARVLGRLSHEYHNNGNINWDDSYVKLAGWLLQHLSDDSVFNAKQILQIEQDIEQIFNDAQTGRGAMSPEEPHYSRLKQNVVIWCKRHPEKIEYNSGLPF